MESRSERDTLGEMEVPSARYWGAQTQRALSVFDIGTELYPKVLIHSLALVKRAAAVANAHLGQLGDDIAQLIVRAATEVESGALDSEFPLKIWMSGSGTPCHMNVNEVIANRANEIAGRPRGSNYPVHPNDHVNRSQSTNDVMPTAMHIAVCRSIILDLMPAVEELAALLGQKAGEWSDIVKVGRTHLQDAVPITLGQEFSGYVAMLEDDLARLRFGLEGLYPVPLGGTGVGTGLNAPAGFADAAIREISIATDLPFVPAANRFSRQGAHDGLVTASGMLRTLAGSLRKIADDIRLLASGPRAGLFELVLPTNEPGSSFMPGKANPTQCEMLAMVAIQVMGYDVAVGLAGSGGHLEMNAYKPLIAFDVLQSVRLLSDASRSFTQYLVAGMTPNRTKIEKHLQQSLMNVTAMAPVVGYQTAAQIAQTAFEEGITLREAALASGSISVQDFDRLMDFQAMANPLGPDGMR
ncbi:MAG: class II fumarate hydratase [Actinobacteria bacterium]|nr:class II fumarate hydratase [Actinomycetota bacterium]